MTSTITQTGSRGNDESLNDKLYKGHTYLIYHYIPTYLPNLVQCLTHIRCFISVPE